ncbi:transcriptional regulator, PadR-like family [Staphylothermus hellenicus DSM 12710]|uniref:Transcriptional regulator, PadR-like family n=2 Tax=Staphylothermus hellenicus TaxID=84599 RepID=D7D8L6_STAHD|nr:transcriptional regulator, PadR-like family [Staphylothermus hellenicus DSM 12710]
MGINMQTRKKKFRSVFKIKVLGIIIKNREIHGYGIYKELLDLIHGLELIEKPSIGTIYRILNELLEEGFIEKRIQYKGRRKIILYHPTSKGINEFLRISRAFLTKTLIGLKLVISAINSIGEKHPDIDEIRERLRNIHNITST